MALRHRARRRFDVEAVPPEAAGAGAFPLGADDRADRQESRPRETLQVWTSSSLSRLCGSMYGAEL